MCFQLQCLNNEGDFPDRCLANWQDNSITIMITDDCPECSPDQIDLQALTFAKVTTYTNITGWLHGSLRPSQYKFIETVCAMESLCPLMMPSCSELQMQLLFS